MLNYGGEQVTDVDPVVFVAVEGLLLDVEQLDAAISGRGDNRRRIRRPGTIDGDDRIVVVDRAR